MLYVINVIVIDNKINVIVFDGWSFGLRQDYNASPKRKHNSAWEDNCKCRAAESEFFCSEKPKFAQET